jgi:hypothetical protein
MVYSAWRARVPVIDITPSVTVVHQMHDYRHYPGGLSSLYLGDEGRRNRALAGDPAIKFGLRDATHVITARGILSAWRARGLWRRLLQKIRQSVHLLRAVHPALNKSIGIGIALYRKLRRSNSPVGWTRPGPRI